MTELAKIIIGLGIALVSIGVILYFFHDRLHWLGHLPGDISVEKENFRFYFPVMTLIVINLVLWISACLWRKFRG